MFNLNELERAMQQAETRLANSYMALREAQRLVEFYAERLQWTRQQYEIGLAKSGPSELEADDA